MNLSNFAEQDGENGRWHLDLGDGVKRLVILPREVAHDVFGDDAEPQEAADRVPDDLAAAIRKALQRNDFESRWRIGGRDMVFRAHQLTREDFE